MIPEKLLQMHWVMVLVNFQAKIMKHQTIIWMLIIIHMIMKELNAPIWRVDFKCYSNGRYKVLGISSEDEFLKNFQMLKAGTMEHTICI